MIRELTEQEVNIVYERFVVQYFPEDEVKPLKRIQCMIQDGCYHVFGLFTEDQKMELPVACAFVTTYQDTAPGAYLLDYLAVDLKKRSAGYGSTLLLELAGGNYTDHRPILIETEMLEKAKDERQKIQRQRRNAFYEKNHAVMSSVKTCIFGVYYNNWVLGTLEDDKVEEELIKIYRYMVPPEYYTEKIKIPV